MTSTSSFGGCACDRFQYTVDIPSSSVSQAQVFFDNSVTGRRAQATPLTAWSRVPLDWYHSTTYAFYPDETALSIRKVFHLADTQRQFCGYCGTHSTGWSEREREDGRDWIDVTLGSLERESEDALEGLGVSGNGDEEEEMEMETEGESGGEGKTEEEDGGGEKGVKKTALSRRIAPAGYSVRPRGMPWFESLVENTRFGRVKRRRGGYTTSDGTTMEQWEIEEWNGDDDGGGDSDSDEMSGGKKRRIEIISE